MNYQVERGRTRSPLMDSLVDRRMLDAHASRLNTVELARVFRYHHDTQLVDVQLLVDGPTQVIGGIPIVGSGGLGARIIRYLPGARDVGDLEPDVGLLVYPRLSSLRALLSFARIKPDSKLTHIQDKAVYIPGIYLSQGSVKSTPPLASLGLQPKDSAFITPSGSGLIIREDGSLELRGTVITNLPPAMSILDSSIKSIIREGDTGDGGAAAGAIQGPGSTISRSA